MPKKQKHDVDFYAHQTWVMIVLAVLVGGLVGYVVGTAAGGTGLAAKTLSSSLEKAAPTGTGRSYQEAQILGDGLVINEPLYNELTGVGKQHLTILGDEEIQNEFGTFHYRQNVMLPDKSYMTFARVDEPYIPEEMVDVPSFYLMLGISINDVYAYLYSLGFQQPLITENSDKLRLVGLEGEELKMMGYKYAVFRAYHTQTNYLKLQTMTGYFHDTLAEGSSKTYIYNGKTYAVKVKDIEPNLDPSGVFSIEKASVKFAVNGEETAYLIAGQIYTLQDGINIGLYSVKPSEGRSKSISTRYAADIFFAAHTLDIEDANTNEEGGGNSGMVTLDGTPLSNVLSDIIVSADYGIEPGDRVEIAAINIGYYPSTDLYVPLYSFASDAADISEGEEGNFLIENFDFIAKGLEQAQKYDPIFVSPLDSNNYVLSFMNKAGVEYEASILAAPWGAPYVLLGEFKDNKFIPFRTSENETIKVNSTFAASKRGYSNLLRLREINFNDKHIIIQDIGDLREYEIAYSGPENEGTMVLNGNIFNFKVGYSLETGGHIFFDMNGDGDYEDINVLSVSESCLWTYYGGKILLSVKPTGIFDAMRIVDGECEYPSDCSGPIKMEFYSQDGVINFDAANIDEEATEWQMLQYRERNMYHAYTPYGTKIIAQIYEGDEQWDANFWYPKEQSKALVYAVGKT